MRALRLLHRWLGLLLALPLLVLGLTGALLTIQPVWPEFGPTLASDTAVPANRVLAAALAATPPGLRLARYSPGGPGQPVRVGYAPEGNPRGPGVSLSFDPATATPLGTPQPTSVTMNWIKRLHQNLLLPEYGGRQIAGWLGVGLVLVVGLGIPLWWPRSRGPAAPNRWRAALTVPPRARGLRLQRALHGASGAWLSAMLLVTGVTGISQGFPQTTRLLLGQPSRSGPGQPGPGQSGPGQPGGGPPRGPRQAPGAVPGATVPAPDLDAAFHLAQAALPGLVPTLAILPQGNEPLRLFMAPPGQEGAVVTRIVTVDPTGTRLISVPTEPGAGDMTLRWVHDLHEGAGLGPVWRGLVVLTGVALPGFGITGVVIWLMKRRNRRRVAQQAAAERAVALS